MRSTPDAFILNGGVGRASLSEQIINFVRKKDYVLVRELGQGACGKTVVLRDDLINESFACKKYTPCYEHLKEELFDNFVREIGILYKINHKNVVRIFSYHLYPDVFTGYFLMELIDGCDIETFLSEKPEYINIIFRQTIDGFCHLEQNEILHRDIRPMNILVSKENTTKIIDFGFGKNIEKVEDFYKSITLNWWCDTPDEFDDKIYNYGTEVYFVGKLFEKIINQNKIEQFSYSNILSRMCEKNPSNRFGSFVDIKDEIISGRFSDMSFSEEEIESYRTFANHVTNSISKIEKNAKYFITAFSRIEDMYMKVQLEIILPRNSFLISCFINGPYSFIANNAIYVADIKSFVEMLRSSSQEKRNIILANLHSRLNAIPRYETELDDEIPF